MLADQQQTQVGEELPYATPVLADHRIVEDELGPVGTEDPVGLRVKIGPVGADDGSHLHGGGACPRQAPRLAAAGGR